MLWATLAILGIPIWLVLGALGASQWSRRRFKAQPGVFRLAWRASGAEKWPRMGAYGRVIHDVVVVTRGIALVRTAVHGINAARPRDFEGEVRGFDKVAAFEITLDDGSIFEVAVDPDDADQFKGLPSPQATDDVMAASQSSPEM
jgi:hypothetical protein